MTNELSPIKGFLKYLGQEKIPPVIPVNSIKLSIGSDARNDLCLEGGNLSRHHAVICYDPSLQKFAVTDLQSTNGTYLQGKKIPPKIAHPISDEDYIQFSQIPFKFMYEQTDSKTCFVPPEKIEVKAGQSSAEDSEKNSSLPTKEKKTEEQGKSDREEHTDTSVINEILLGSGNVSYKIEKKLKSGGMGSLYKAIRMTDKVPVVVKFLHTSDLNNSKNVLRFLTEARAIIELSHENIVKGLDLHNDLKRCFLVMEYIEGKNIEEMLLEQDFLSIEISTDIVRQITRALIYLEQKKIYHRDIKPANIIWTHNRIAKLVDFGIVKFHNVGLTSDGYVMGTAFYISPEQLEGKSLDIRTDVYSLGATYYNMVVGSPPFEDQAFNTGQLMTARLQECPKRADLVNPQVPKEVGKLLDQMMQPGVDRRIKPKELLAALDKILAQIRH